jgi:hypothetical protein
MKLLSIVLLLAVLSLALVGPAFAMEGECDHDPATIESLVHCVHHAQEMGHIANAGVANALQAKLDGAQAALDRGQPDVAINKLNAFVNQVQAQAGVHIHPAHAEHMIMHARMVIAALES